MSIRRRSRPTSPTRFSRRSAKRRAHRRRRTATRRPATPSFRKRRIPRKRLRERDPRIADLLDRGWATNGYRAGWLRQRRDARLAEESGLTALLARLDADETGADEAAAARQPASDIDPDDDAVRDAKRALARQAAKEIWHGTRENPTADALLSLFPQAADAVAAVGNLPCSDFLRSLERTKAEAWATLVHGMRDEDREAASARIASAGDPQAFVKAVSAAINAGR
jgi:hypothetical protein